MRRSFLNEVRLSEKRSEKKMGKHEKRFTKRTFRFGILKNVQNCAFKLRHILLGE